MQDIDHKIIFDMVEPGASVLDLGCGDGELLYSLINEKQVKAQGIEIDTAAVLKCAEKGICVYHSNIDEGLSDYTDSRFDYVILNQSMQQVIKPEYVLGEALRVGRRVIVGFPNFAFYKARFQLAIMGRTPVTPSLPFHWYDTPNLHFLTIADFVSYCREKKILIERVCATGKKRTVKILPNFFGRSAIFLIQRKL